MNHPFQVGGQYRNRDGEYEVVELDGPKMVIRYSDGRRLEATVKIQKRIWKNIQAEERMRSEARQRSPGPRPKGKSRTKLGMLVEQNIASIFIAYAFPYVEEAIAACEDAQHGVEAVVVQPYCKSRIVSARKAMEQYRALTNGQHIPILFTRQTRHQDQVFAYGSRLLDLCHEVEISRVRKNVDAGRWLVWDKTLYASNYMIVKTPIRALADKRPIEVARNVLPGRTQGDPVGAVSIPAPKALDPAVEHLLDDL